MQTKSSASFLLRLSFALTLLVAASNCKKNISPEEEITSAASTQSASKASKAPTPAQPHFNLEVILRGEEAGFGHVSFRQRNDAAKIILLNAWVRNLEPNHQYLLQRAVDTNLDGNCTSTTWLTLGKGLSPKPITTDEKGTAKEELWRDLSAVPAGTTFDIHFQVVDAATLEIVLTSDCYEFTVR